MLFVRRYIDDIGAFNVPTFNGYKYTRDDRPTAGIYPSQFLQLNEEQAPTFYEKSEGQGHRLLDLYITTHNCKFVADIIHHDQDDRPFKEDKAKHRYQHFSTLLATQAKYNVVTAQMHRFHRLCMTKHGFLRHCAAMITQLITRGYEAGNIFRKIRRYLITRKDNIYDAAHGDDMLTQIQRKWHSSTAAQLLHVLLGGN